MKRRMSFILAAMVIVATFQACSEKDGEKTIDVNGNAKRIDEYENGELITGKCFNIDGEEIDYFDYTVMPKFPDGDEGLSQYLSNEIRYPRYSRRNNIEGRVYIEFAIEIDGSISDIKILRSVSAEIDNEAIRVVNEMPKWIPGKEDGEIEKVYYRVPITFRLR